MEVAQTGQEQITTPQDTSESNVNEDIKGNGEAQPEAQTKADPKAKESSFTKEQILQFCQHMGVPPEIKPTFKDGQLKFIIPMDGKKFLVDPVDVFKGWNLNQAGYKNIQEGKKLKAEFNQFIANLKQNPKNLMKWARNLGIDTRELSAQELEEFFKEQEMTPEQKAQAQKIREAEEAQAELEQLRREKAQSNMSREVAKETQRYNQELRSAMSKHGFDTATKADKAVILAKAVEKLTMAQRYQQPLSCDDAVYLAKQEARIRYGNILGEVDDDQIIEFIGPDNVRRIQAALVKMHENPLRPPATTPSKNAVGQRTNLQEFEEDQSAGKRPKKKTSVSDFFRNLPG